MSWHTFGQTDAVNVLGHRGPVTSFEAEPLILKVPDSVTKGSSAGHQDHHRRQGLESSRDFLDRQADGMIISTYCKDRKTHVQIPYLLFTSKQCVIPVINHVNASGSSLILG